MLHRPLALIALLTILAAACSSTSSAKARDACSTLETRAIEAITMTTIVRTKPEAHDGATSCTWSTASGDAVAVTIGAARSGSRFASSVADSTSQFGPSQDVVVIGATDAVAFPDAGVVEMVVGGRLVTVQQLGFVESGQLHPQLADAVARGMR